MIKEFKNKKINTNRIKGCLYGLIVGDALGVPVEFKERTHLKKHPIKTMIGSDLKNQKYNYPAGMWSDDSSMNLLTIESLIKKGYNPSDMMYRFGLWLNDAYMTPFGTVFDIGITTKKAIERYNRKQPKSKWGLTEEKSNGNGSLMRIAPIACYFLNSSDNELIKKAMEVSSLTHAHVRSQLACAYLCILLKYLLKGKNLINSLNYTNEILKPLISKNKELSSFSRILDTKNLIKSSENKIESSGYVIHTLEASIWCAANTNTFKSSVLKAVNLGDDTDTTACITGMITGSIYGNSKIPSEWKEILAKKNIVSELINNFVRKIK